MYATPQVNRPSQSMAHATTFIKKDNFLDDTFDRHNNLRGRILTYCAAGTLGLLSPAYLHASAATANWNINKIEFSDARVVTADTSSSVSAQDITHIRKALKISVSELARVFGVSRQAVHEWINGGALSKLNAQRLSEFARAADVLIESGIELTPQMLRRKISSGNSLLESVKENGKVIALAHVLIDTLLRETQQRRRLEARLAGRKKPALAASDFGMPHLDENT